MKRLMSLKDVKELSKIKQKNISGGGKGPSCQEIFTSGDCCHPRWTSCGFAGANCCINGVCIL
jgi:hypothetical protein